MNKGESLTERYKFRAAQEHIYTRLYFVAHCKRPSCTKLRPLPISFRTSIGDEEHLHVSVIMSTHQKEHDRLINTSKRSPQKCKCTMSEQKLTLVTSLGYFLFNGLIKSPIRRYATFGWSSCAKGEKSTEEQDSVSWLKIYTCVPLPQRVTFRILEHKPSPQYVLTSASFPTFWVPFFVVSIFASFLFVLSVFPPMRYFPAAAHVVRISTVRTTLPCIFWNLSFPCLEIK